MYKIQLKYNNGVFTIHLVCIYGTMRVEDQSAKECFISEVARVFMNNKEQLCGRYSTAMKKVFTDKQLA